MIQPAPRHPGGSRGATGVTGSAFFTAAI
jgi:hypothetical protein